MDRDGTICAEVGYVNHVSRLELLPGSAEAIRRLNAADLQTVAITNQAGVARGYFPEELVADVHDRLRELLGEGGARLDGIYYCPHHPEVGDERYRRVCDCRKPAPGMLHRARDEMGVDLTRSYVIGDRYRDLAAGIAVGATPILVLTGYGRGALEYESDGWPQPPAFVAEDLLRAVDWILDRERDVDAGVESPAAAEGRVV